MRKLKSALKVASVTLPQIKPTPLREPHTGTIRKLWPSEREAFIAHLLRLDVDTRRNRFGTAVNDEFLTHYAQQTFGVGGIVFGYVENGEVRGAAELRGLDDVTTDGAEAAFSVEQAWRRRGIGEILFQHLITAARNRNHGRLFMTCLRSNLPMQALARKYSAVLERDIDEVQGLLDAGKPTPFTLIDEAMDDARSFATLTLDVQKRFWRRAWLRRSHAGLRSNLARERQPGAGAGNGP
jgi:GNAT superfamily N-acetyltransferase